MSQNTTCGEEANGVRMANTESNAHRSIEKFTPMRIPTVTHNSLMPINGKGGKPKIVKTPELREAEATWEAHLAPLRNLVPDGPLSGGLAVSVRFAFQANEEHPVGTMHVTKPDADNLEKTLWDVLQRLDVIEDDSRIFFKEIAKLYADVPGVWIRLEEMEV